MKKITLWLSFVLTMFFTTINAQQDFETATVGALPTGWTSAQSASDDPGFTVQNASGYAHGGSSQYLVHLGVDIASESTSWVVSSAQTVGSAYELRFFWRGKWSTAYNYTGVYVSTTSNDPVANPGDFTLLEELSPANYPNTWLQWNEVMYDLSAYSGQIYIAFKYVGDHAHDFYIDDLSVEPIPYCEVPGSIDVNNRYTDSLDISWTGVVGHDNYEVVWGALGFDPNAASVTPTQVTSTTYTITGLTPSTHYDIYVRTACSSYNYSSWVEPKIGFTDGPPPANDDCSNAEVLTVYPFGGSSGNEVITNTLNATDSGVHPSCDTIDTNIDLYYTFTVPSGSSGIIVTTGGVKGNRIEAALYDSCGGSELDCKRSGSVKIFDGLTAGITYVLQVWHDEGSNQGEFTIAVEATPPPPANDECDNAIALTVNADLNCGSVTSGTNVSATASPQPDDVTGTPNNDVWYSFVATNSRHFITLSNVVAVIGTNHDMGMGLYDGSAGCSALVLVEDSDPNEFTVSGLTVGTTYLLRVYGWYLSGSAQTTFDICVGTPPPLANDLCVGAIPLTVYNSLQTVTGSNTSATDSGETAPGCGNYSGGDIWYSVVVPADGNVTVESAAIANSGVSDTGLAVYSGTCGSLVLIECNDDIGYPNYFSLVNVTGATPGETLYVRVWEYGNNAFGEIGIGAYNSSLSVSDNKIEGFNFYPNPVTSELNITANDDIQNVAIYDISGKQVITIQPNSLETKIDFSSLKSGIYFVKARIANKVTAFKIIKK